MKYTFIFFFFINLLAYSQQETQTTVYLDENEQPISMEDYYKKCTSFLYFCKQKVTSNLKLNTIYEIIKYGQLDSIQNNQIKNILIRDTGNKNVYEKPIIINFRDTIFGYEELKTRYTKYIQKQFKTDDSTNNKSIPEFNLSEYKYSKHRKEFDKNQKKCFKAFRKLDYTPLYIYKNSSGYNYKPEHYKWIKLSKPLHYAFFKGRNSSVMILKPNGQYFIYYHMSEKYLAKLLINDWSELVSDYELAKSSLIQQRFGVFKDYLPEKPESKSFYFIKSNGIGKSLIKGNNSNTYRPRNAIGVRDRSEISEHLKGEYNCYSHAGY